MKLLCMHKIRLKMSKDKTKKKLPKWLDVTLRVIEWTLIIFIVVCMLTLLSQRMTGTTPELFGYSTYTVVTDSMAGTYDVGDVVVCKRIKDTLGYMKDTGFKEGEVIAFIAPAYFDKDNKLQGCTITHRIVTAPFYDEEKDTWFVETKGDNAIAKDRVPIPVENIQGTIVGSNKGISKLFKFLTKWYGFVTVIVVPLTLILVWQIVVLIREKSKATISKIEDEKVNALKQIEQDKLAKEEEIKAKAIEEYKQSLTNQKEE